MYTNGLIKNSYFQDTIIVTNQGDVTGSTSLINNSEWYIGNVANKNISDIWLTGVGAAIERLSVRSNELVKNGICSGCKAARFCRGGDPIIFAGIDNDRYCGIKEELTDILP